MSIPVHNNLNMNSNEIQDVSIEKLAAHPSGGGLYNGRIWELTTDNKIYYYNGTAIIPIASENFVTSAINQLGQIQGGFDASSGLLPVAANKTQGDLTTVKKGDFWVITTAGTIAGIAGADELAIGDIIQFFGSTPATAADWLGIQRNINDALLGNVLAEKQTVNLVANVPLAVNAATVANIHSIQVYNSAGDLILLDIQKLGGNNQRTLTSKKALTGVVVEITGT